MPTEHSFKEDFSSTPALRYIVGLHVWRTDRSQDTGFGRHGAFSEYAGRAWRTLGIKVPAA